MQIPWYVSLALVYAQVAQKMSTIFFLPDFGHLSLFELTEETLPQNVQIYFYAGFSVMGVLGHLACIILW